MPGRIHGMDGTPEYKAWIGARARCNNPNDKSYTSYGGRGIKVCSRWDHSFEAFYEDMGKRPSNNHPLDRINVDGNYEPKNCRWATKRQQRVNRRTISGTGHTGISVERNRFRVRILVNDNYKHIGIFNDLNSAITARKMAERKYWDESYS